MSSRSPATSITGLLRSIGAFRRLTTAIKDAETNRPETTSKRFWKEVGIEKHGESFAVTLDKRPLKTPSGNALLLPRNKTLVASLIATEWDNQEKMIKPHALPLTSLAARAIDAFKEKETRTDIHASLLRYLDTDTICFYQDHPSHLVDLQTKHWDPLHEWMQKTYDVKIQNTNSIIFNSQSDETKQKLRKVLEGLDQWELAAMERATMTTKSFIIALALVKRYIGPEEASSAAHVEVNSQIERWGEVEDTHDVDYHDVRRQLGSVACLISAL
ncbi:hypothetical protein APHAL10511_007065 [Amanita phalloides]|nr:hypothetical protein APHAL10511_007065 [Amanita phalloides]